MCWTLESPLDCGEIKPVNPKGNQPWIFSGRTDAEALILWPPDIRIWLIRKDPDAGKDWRQEEKWSTEDEMVREPHWLNRHVSEQIPRDGEGQGSQVCCSPWGYKESDMTEQLNNNCLPWTVPDIEDTKKLAQSVLEEHTVWFGREPRTTGILKQLLWPEWCGSPENRILKSVLVRGVG